MWDKNYKFDDGDWHDQYLPFNLGSWNGTIDIQYVLADMNDAGKTFEEIANWIERNLPTKD